VADSGGYGIDGGLAGCRAEDTGEMHPAPDELAELTRRILMVVQPRRVLLFGSAARGTMREDSDLDVLVVVDEGVPRRQTAQAIYRNLIGFSRSVDIVVAWEDDLVAHGRRLGLVFQPALREGQVIYAA